MGGDNINKKAMKHFLGDASSPKVNTPESVKKTMDEKFEQMKRDFLVNKQGLPFVNESNNPNPEYKHSGDSGFDLRADLEDKGGHIHLEPLERFMVPTGLYFDIPMNYEIQVRPRSGMAAKHGIGVLNSPGTVDSSYQGEVKVILVNLSNESFTINHGDRIAQAVLSPVFGSDMIELKKVDKIDKETTRGSGGFGSTGYK